jgi:hypothetical protein
LLQKVHNAQTTTILWLRNQLPWSKGLFRLTIEISPKTLANNTIKLLEDTQRQPQSTQEVQWHGSQSRID